MAARAVTVVSASRRLRRGSKRSPTVAAMTEVIADVVSGDSLTKGVPHEQLQAMVEDSSRSVLREQMGDSERLDTTALRSDKKRLAAIVEAQGLLLPLSHRVGLSRPSAASRRRGHRASGRA